jgi:predicted ArsR family transcriptional regulator
MIYTQVTKSSFIDAFKLSSRKDQFSYEALEAIFEYLEDYSNDTGENVELDIVAICCEWVEMTWQEVADQYNVDLSQCTDDDERIDAVEEYLQDETHSVRLSDDSFVFVSF